MSGDFSLAGRAVIVTGAGQGIGATYARRFAEAGASVALADINGANAASVASEIERAGGRALAIQVDVADETATLAMAEEVVSRFGRIDVLINNAALFTTLSRGAMDELPVEEWRRVMDVNVTGGFLCSRAVVPHMRAGGYGRIVMISSSTVPMGRPNFAHYVTSKAAVIGMARSMARELGPFGITVNAVLPGLTDTGIEAAGVTSDVWDTITARQCIPRREVPDDLAGTLLFLASPASAFLTGQSILVDGGSAHL